MNHFTKKIAYLIFFACIAKLSFAQYIGGSGSGFSNSNQSTINCDKPSQFYPYNGGISSGHSVSTYTLTNCSIPPQFFAYTGGSGSGSAVHSPPTITCSSPSQFFAYNGGNGDGFANNATAPITCSTPNQFYAYYGGSSDGFARDTFTNCPTQPPVTNFTASSQTVCAGSTVNFTDLSTRNPSSWSWSFQGGSPLTSNLQNPSITYNTPGTYSVSLTATNLMGSNTYSVATFITVVALPAANAGSDISICSSSSTTLTATGGTTYSWTPVNSLSNPSIANPVASPTATTVYTVTMSNGTCSSLDTVKVTVVPVPTINVTNDLALCSGSSTTLSATGGNSYSWAPSTGLSSTTTATTTANPTITTTYTVTGSNGLCTSKDSVTVTVNTLPTANITANGVTTFCQGNSVTLSANTGTGLTYQWKNNGNSIFGATTSTLSATSTGSYAVVITNNNNCTATSNAISVIVNPNVTPSFTQVPSICVGENLSALPTTSNNNITGSWAPALNNTATTTYTFTPTSGQCALNTQMTITINPGTTPTFNQISPICVGDNFNALPTTSTNNISGSWSPTVNNTATTTYTFTPNAGQCAVTTQMTINVNPLPNATITANGTTTFCQGNSVTLSANTGTGLTYQWRNNGNIISSVTTSTLNVQSTGTYSVIITNNNNCSVISNAISVIVNPNVTPSFTQVPSICVGENLSALPTTSNNNITGSWAPALNNTATTIYTFIPTSGQCAVNTQMTITVNPGTTPTFNQVSPICVGDNLNALPTTSTNNISGSWSPTVNNTATTTYTFTPNAGQCASTTILTINVNPLPNATITANGATTFCQGNSVTLSANTGTGLTYQWRNNGNIISSVTTPTLNVQSTGTYSVIITNNNNCSAISNAISITVNPNVTPTFTQVSPICVGEALSALPTTSNNNITGSWAPALNNNATTTYTFTPTSGQCAVNTQMTITINPGTTPTFNQVSPICVGDNLSALPTSSTNNIIGSWSPTVNNTATTTYTFTPNAGQCAVTTQMTINVTSGTIPSFSQIGPFCSGDNLLPLPTTSTNGIFGSWSPSLNSVSNTTYTFTPNAGQCASSAIMSITIHPRPSATISAGSTTTFCQGGSVTLSANIGSGLTYQWSTNETTPSINVTASGNYFVNVTNSFNCSSTSNSISVTVHPIGFAQISSSSSTTFCQGDSVILQANSGASYSWSTGATTQSIVVYNPGIYHVSVVDINNCATTTPIDSVEIIVNSNPATPTITSNRSTALCIGDTVILTSSIADSYLWNINSTNNSIAVTTQGNYFVTVYNQFGCSATSAPTSVTVNDPLVDFTADTLLVFIPAANVNFTAVTNGVPAYTYNWSFGNGNTSVSSSPTTTYFNIGFYDVTLSLTDNTGCTKTITKPNYIQVEQLFPSYPAITNTTEDITSMAYNDPTTGIMTLMNGNCILSTDSGNTWNPLNTGNTEPLFCSYTVPGKWFVAGANGTILQSIDNGLNWNIMNSGTQQFIKGCGFTSSPVRGYAVGTNGLINYFDGINWNIQTSLTSNDLNGVYVFEDGRAYVAGNQSTILYYNGTSWTNQTSPLNFDVKEIRFADQNLGYAVGRNGIILKTTDAGNTWDPSLTGVDVDFNSVEAIGTDSAWATGTGGIVYTTTNAGLSWTRYSVGDTDNQSSLRVKGGKGHLSGNSGNARNFSSGNSGQTVTVYSNNFTGVINEFKLYPIPANNKVEISGNLFKTKKLSIQIKDVLGKTIDQKTYSDVDGSIQINLNTSDYLNGIYFIHIQQDTKSWVQKFIIEK